MLFDCRSFLKSANLSFLLNQVWSLSQFYFNGFLQSRIVLNKCVFIIILQSKFVSAVFDNVLECPCHCSTHDCVLVSIKFGSNAGGEVEGLCKGTMLTEKAFKVSATETRKFCKGCKRTIYSMVRSH